MVTIKKLKEILDNANLNDEREVKVQIDETLFPICDALSWLDGKPYIVLVVDNSEGLILS